MAKHRFFLTAALLYTLAHLGLFFAPNSVYWDDWVLFQSSPDTIRSMFQQAGSPFNWTAHLHNTLMPLGPWIYKVLTFAFYLIAGRQLEHVLRKFTRIPEAQRFIIVTLFLVLPFNMARIAAIDLPYGLNVLLFFTAWRFIEDRPKTSAALFFLSFNTNSHLVFYALPILDILYRSNSYRNVLNLLKFIRDRAIFLMIPFVYFGVKTVVFKPSGVYAGYKEGYNLRSVPYSILEQLRDLYRLELNWTATLILAPLCFAALSRLTRNLQREHGFKPALSLLGAGTLALLLGLFPYWILFLTPTFVEWTSRHQLLMPLGTTLFLSAVVFSIPRIFATSLFSLLVAASLTYSGSAYKQFYVDWKKQEALIELFRTTSEIRDSNLIIFEDQTKPLNAIKRNYRFYE